MKFSYLSSRFDYVHRKEAIYRSWYFRFASLAFIALVTPSLAFYMHGFAGFLLILVLAVLAGLVEGTFSQTLHSISKGISQNKLLFVFVIWYFAGFILNTFIRGNGLDDWRLMLSPLVMLISLLYVFAFLHDNLCYRSFQIGLLIITGIQTFFSAQILIATPDIARIMWAETSGAWIYGNQYIYTAYAIAVPVLIWRSFKESGLLRLILILSCLLMFITSSISSFATPLGLTILSALIVLALSFSLPRRKIWTALLVGGIVSTIGVFGYQYAQDNPLFYQAYFRIENFIRNPESGGYDLRIPTVTSRWDLAGISISTFQAEPLFGIGGPREYNPFIGGHSSFFDSLAIYGILGGGGALCGVILIMVVKAALHFRRVRNWETLLVLTSLLLMTVAGIVDPYWEPLLPIALIIARPLNMTETFQ